MLLSFMMWRLLNTDVQTSHFRENVGREVFFFFFKVSFVNRYCSTRDKLTIDHVLPAARGGEWKWENLVT